MSGHAVAGGAATPAAPSIWRAEFSDTVRLALPMALTQLGQIAMMTTDLALLGRLGDRVVAATALAHTILFGAFVIGMGIVSAVAPLAAQAFGAQQPHLVRRALRVGLRPCSGCPSVSPSSTARTFSSRSDRNAKPRRWQPNIFKAWAGA
jgi:MATE family multidrug resistance protein